MRVSSLLMRMLEVTIPKCKVGHKFPGVKFYSHAISAGRSHNKCPEDCQEGRLVFLEAFSIMPIKEAITLVTHEFSFSFFYFQYSPNNIQVFQISMQIYTQVAANPR